jgi:hypothetical protein
MGKGEAAGFDSWADGFAVFVIHQANALMKPLAALVCRGARRLLCRAFDLHQPLACSSVIDSRVSSASK